MRPIVLTVAGSDSSGGAGIQADLKAIEANGGYAASVITAVTAQNTRQVLRADALAPDLVSAQLDAVFSDLDVAAVKTGMLADGAIVRVLAEALVRSGVTRVVCDPVMISKGGAALLAPEALSALRQEIFPLTALLTPNVHEAQALCDMTIRGVGDAAVAGRRLLDQGARAVLVKGGHLAEQPAADVLVTPRGTQVFEGEFIETRHTHGTGCTYSAAIATHLALGASLEGAIRRAKSFVTEAIRHGLSVGKGIGPTDPFYFLRQAAATPAAATSGAGPAPGSEPLARPVKPCLGRLHVLTDEELQDRFSHAELASLAVRGGADTVQYRDKRPRTTAEHVAVARAMLEAMQGSGSLIVNDRADVAVAVGADGTHLGRDDLEAGAARTLLGPRRLIGGTANSFEEALLVAGSGLDYLGVGPVFGTRSKRASAAELGLSELRRIAAAVELPVVAIGNISAERIADVMACGVHGVALLSSVVCAADPLAAAALSREALDQAMRERGNDVHSVG